METIILKLLFIFFLFISSNVTRAADEEAVFSDVQTLRNHLIGPILLNESKLVITLTPALVKEIFKRKNSTRLVSKRAKPTFSCSFIQKGNNFELTFGTSKNAQKLRDYLSNFPEANVDPEVKDTPKTKTISNPQKLLANLRAHQPSDEPSILLISESLKDQLFETKSKGVLAIKNRPDLSCGGSQKANGDYIIIFSVENAQKLVDFLTNREIQPTMSLVVTDIETNFIDFGQMKEYLDQNPPPPGQLRIRISADLKKDLFEVCSVGRLQLKKTAAEVHCEYLLENGQYVLLFYEASAAKFVEFLATEDIPSFDNALTQVFRPEEIHSRSAELEFHVLANPPKYTVFSTEEDLKDYIAQNPISGDIFIHIGENLKRNLFKRKNKGRLILKNSIPQTTCRYMQLNTHFLLRFSRNSAIKLATQLGANTLQGKRLLETAPDVPKAKKVKLNISTQAATQCLWRISFDHNNQCFGTVITEMSGIWGMSNASEGNLVLARDGYCMFIDGNGEQICTQMTGMFKGIGCCWQNGKTWIYSNPFLEQTLFAGITTTPPYFYFPFPHFEVIALAPNPNHRDQLIILNTSGLHLFDTSNGKLMTLHKFIDDNAVCVGFTCVSGEFPDFYVGFSNSQSIWKISTDPLMESKETEFAFGFTDLRSIAYSEPRNQFIVAESTRALILESDGTVFQEIAFPNNESFSLESTVANQNGDFFILAKFNEGQN